MTARVKDLKEKFWATGVGSMPHTDALQAVTAATRHPDSFIPFWPQLPRRSFFENMYVQFSEGFPGVRVDVAEKSIGVDTGAPEYLAAFEKCFADIQEANVERFAISGEAGAGLSSLVGFLMGLAWEGWVKAQVIGPVSMALSILDEKKKPILYNAELREILPSFLGFKAAWAIRQLKVHARTKVIVFIDEPYLVAVGTSACALPKTEIVSMINRTIRLIHENGALAGIHCCGNTDWDMVMGTDIDILNFDAYNYLDKFLLYQKAVKAFIGRGGIPAYGIVPNDETLDQEGTPEHLWERLVPHRELLQQGALVTTSCGCAGLSVAQSEKALELSVSLAQRLTEELSE